jgi:protein SCO1/2
MIVPSRPYRYAALAIVVAAVAVAAVVGARVMIRETPRLGAATNLDELGVYGRVPPFSLVERSGRRVTADALRGSVWIVDFIYTECTDSCPTQSLQFAQLQREFAAEEDFRLVSITVDPTHDTPEVLSAYAHRYAATDRWWFLTGDTGTIYCLARDGLRLGVIDVRVSDPPQCGAVSWLSPASAWASHVSQGLVMHSARVVLVDRNGRIRAYHVATDERSMTALRTNLKSLLSEAPGPAR